LGLFARKDASNQRGAGTDVKEPRGVGTDVKDVKRGEKTGARRGASEVLVSN